MSRTYTKREIASILDCSVRTVEADADYLNLRPTAIPGKSNLYSTKDYQLISQMRTHCSTGSDRDSFVPQAIPEIVEENPVVTRMIHQVQKLPVVESLQTNLIEEIKLDPFYDLEMLQRVSDRKWLLPAKRLAPLFRISPKYLNSMTRYEYCGFIATKEIYSHNIAYWRVEANNS